jgi:hypothetical protein
MSSEPLPLLKEALKADTINSEELKSILSQVTSDQGKICLLIDFYFCALHKKIIQSRNLMMIVLF